MNVRDAIALMATNPAVDFPWEGTLVGLINGFVSPASQLDPLTATGKEIQDAIEALEPNLKDMIYNSTLGNVNLAGTPPAASSGGLSSTSFHQLFLGFVGTAICAIAIMKVMGFGVELAGTDLVDILKLLVSLALNKPTDGT